AEAETEPAEAETEPAEAETDPAEAETEPAEAVTEPAEAETEPAEAETEPAEAETEPAEAETEPAEEATESSETEDADATAIEDEITESETNVKANQTRSSQSYFRFDAQTGVLTGYTGPGGVVNIPAYINGTRVTEIGQHAFSRKNITKVTIPNTVTKIDNHAFYSNKLTSVTIPDSVNYIGTFTFGSNNLTNVKLSNSLVTIHAGAFQGNRLTSVIIPRSVETIDSQAFGSNKLTRITIPNSVVTIGRSAFSGNNLTELVIPKSVKNIGHGSFQANPDLAKATIPRNFEFYSPYLQAGWYPASNYTMKEIQDGLFGIGKKISITYHPHSHVESSRYIKAGSYIRDNPAGQVLTKLWRPIFVRGIPEGAWFRFTYNGRRVYAATSVTTIGYPPITGYAKQTLNVRDQPAGTGSVIGTIPRGCRVQGVLIYNMVRFTYNGKTAYVYASFLQQKPFTVTRYIKANSIIRSSPNGNQITKLWRPLFVKGTIEGVWLRFTYNGKPAYVATSLTTTSNLVMTGYAKQRINVRNGPNGSIIGTILRGQRVRGFLVGNMVRFSYNGKTGYVYASLLQQNPVKGTRYILANSIIRNAPNGNQIIKLWRPLLVTGTLQGAWFRFTYNGNPAYVATSSTTTSNPPMTGYAKQTVYIRNAPNGDIIGTIPKGGLVHGVLVGNMVRFSYKGKTGYVYASLVQKYSSAVKRYIVAGSIIRLTPDGTIIGKLWRPIYVSGNNEGAWFRFSYGGKTYYVARSVTTTSNPLVTGYAKQKLYVRNAPSGSVIGTIPKGRKVNGVLVGNMVRFTYNGRTGYIYISLLTEHRRSGGVG
ncbi:MAG: leucine-rich repeat protein, partial [Saccharofermentanales bacterium]